MSPVVSNLDVGEGFGLLPWVGLDVGGRPGHDAACLRLLDAEKRNPVVSLKFKGSNDREQDQRTWPLPTILTSPTSFRIGKLGNLTLHPH